MASIRDRVRFLAVDAFRAWLGNRFTTYAGAEGKPKTVSWATRWLASRTRRQYQGVEFFPDHNTNSGIYMRCSVRENLTDKLCHEANIFDERPDPSYGTGAIVNVAKVEPMPKAADKWNTYEIVAKGPKFTVTLNGQRTVDGAQDDKHASGPIALQYAAGFVKFRLVKIKPL